jgi:hypothetical protein
MITYSRIFESYPNHRLLGIESVYFPGSGWTDYTALHTLQAEWPSHDKFLMACHQRGATKVQFIIQDNHSKAIRWTDFSFAEIVIPS